ncbi:tetratricopeptide repeat-containing sensor histidine kinase [Flavobacterium caeni]|uniref:Oxygen sensor histidine kinase NreB n=1 Tax=Flavobacterium caeni TaxID=490189 RepID=A0A1G5CBM7_9FLAO|nr:ATP-binding protein [Flavobacterium caeni]SCX99741.1 Tetratricopeptide repeat-containing protein [Flavobacterium caeni]
MIGFGIFAQGAETDSVDVYLGQQKISKALVFAIADGDARLKKKDYKGYCHTCLKKSKIYTQLNDTQKSIDVLFVGLKVAERHGLHVERVLLLNYIGRSFESGFNNEKSLEYYRKADQVAKKHGRDTLRAFVGQNIYKRFLVAGQYDSAHFYAQRIMSIFKTSKNYDQGYRAHSNLSAYYFTLKQYERGKKHLDSATFYAEKQKKREYLMSSYMNLGYYYLTAKRDFKSGEKQYFKALAVIGNDTLSEDATDCYLNLSYVYEQLNDHKQANVYLNKYVTNTGLVFERKLNSQAKEAETKYEIEKVEDRYRRQQSELVERQSKRQKILIVVIALLVVLAVLFYFFNQNIRLKEKNKLKDIESQLQQNILNATIDGQEIERKKIASVLHDSISAQLSSAGLHLSAFAATKGIDSDEISKTRAILKEAHDKVRDLSHELLPTLLAKFGLLYALQDLCEKNSNSLIEFDYQSNITEKKRYNEDYEMKVYFIVTELLNNVLKHSGASQAKLTVNESNRHLEITISDNGKGFDSAKPISSEGFGLTQIRARIVGMKGKFVIDSKRGHGTSIRIRIPVVD